MQSRRALVPRVYGLSLQRRSVTLSSSRAHLEKGAPLSDPVIINNHIMFIKVIIFFILCSALNVRESLSAQTDEGNNGLTGETWTTTMRDNG